MPAATFPSALLATLALAAVMTFGDFVWDALRLPHRAWYGIGHGALMCLCIGLVIGARAGRPAAGAVTGPIVGVIAAAAFYVLAPVLRYAAMVPAWMLLWILFAILQQHVQRHESRAAAALRGFVTAVLSGLAFYAISGIWTRPSPGGPDYLVHFASWSVAFLPGFLTLFWRR